MRPIAARIAWCVGVAAQYEREPCKSKQTDRDAVWDVDYYGVQ